MRRAFSRSPFFPPMSRVAHLTTVHHALDPRILRKEAATLAAAGYDAHLVAPHGADETRHDVRIHALPRLRGRTRRLRLLHRAYRAARDLGADLYHLHDPELLPVGYALKRRTGARVVYDMHEDYRWKGPVRGRLVRAVERWAFRWVDHVVVANPAQSWIPAASGAAHTAIANYYQPPDTPVEAAEKPPLGDLRVVYTGVMSVERGLLTLVDLAARLQAERPRWRLRLTGVFYLDADRRQAEARIRSHGLAEGAGGTLRRTGWNRYVPHRTILQHTHEAHVGLLLRSTPRYREVLPTKLFEYVSAGLPVVASDTPLHRRFIERHGCGAVVPPGDAKAVFAVLKSWADDPARYAALAAHARTTAPQYQWPVMGRRLVRLYQRLLMDRRPQTADGG